MTSQDVRLEPSEAQSHTSFALEQLLGYAKAAGAAEADALLVAGADTQASMRLGEIEGVERSETSDIGLRVLIGRKQAIVSTSDLSPHALKQLAERAVDMARAAPDTPYVGLADTSELAQSWPQDLDLDDPRDISVEALQDLAIRAEESARAVSGVTNSEGASASASWNEVALATSNGFSGRYRATGYSLAVSVLAGDETTGMERDYDYSSNRHFSDLLSPERLGTSAGEKAVRRLHAKKPKSQKTTVVFDPRVGNSLIGHLAGALNGSSVARGSSFLKDDMGEQVLPDALSLID
ncbi:MAG: metallopeptidase TldD-related protein, partial [Pseudomonadota bacterium]